MSRAVEVVVLWGDDLRTAEILNVDYFSDGRDFSLQDATETYGEHARFIVRETEPETFPTALRAPELHRFGVTSLAAYLMVIATFGYFAPGPSDELTESELRAVYAAYIDMPSPADCIEPPWAEHPRLSPTWVPPVRLPPPPWLLALLRAHASSSVVDSASAVRPLANGRVANVAVARASDVQIIGDLPRRIVLRVIQRHLSELRLCYEQALQTKPSLQGRVTVKLIINPTGAVQAAVVEDSTLAHAATESCIARAINRWNFPAPESSGIVSVTYPFLLQQVGQ